jgi:hypothetical protein
MPHSVARFADGLLASDLPLLPGDRRGAVVAFIGRRVLVLPSITRFGVLVIAAAVDAVGVVLGHDRVRRLVLRLPLPLLAEYPRLIRSLGYAYIWESWPDTDVDGGTDGSRAA